MTKSKTIKIKKNMKYKLKQMTKDELKDLARRIVTNEIFITNTPEGYQMSFGLVLPFVAMSVPKREFVKIGACYADWSHALPRAINGEPCFGSAHLLHKDDLPFLFAEIENVETALGIKPIQPQSQEVVP